MFFKSIKKRGMRMQRILYMITIAVLCFITTPSSAEVYRWVDKQGVQHFSDVPPESGVVGGVEKEPEIPYDAKADEARNAQDKVVMDKMMSEEAKQISGTGGQAAEEAPASPSGGPDQDVEPGVVYEGDGVGVRNDVLGINERAESAPERQKELQQAKEKHQDGAAIPHTEHSDDVLGVNEPAKNAGAPNPVEHHQGGHGARR